MLKRTLKDASFKSFLWLDRLGVHVLPKHYYTPIADHRWLEENKEAWAGRHSLVGIDWDIDQQLEWLTGIVQPFYKEVEGLDFYDELTTQKWGPGYGPIESQVLHCFIRSKRPSTIIEIGSGLSTLCALHAVEMNASPSRIICIEPFPKPSLRALPTITHLEQMCQMVPIETFQKLRAGDLLFVDSSHSVKTGSDVVRIYLDIIPSLPPGVFIHVHDIYLPYLYSRSALSDYFGWQETALLCALLINNPKLRVLGCLSALHYDRQNELKRLLSDYRPQSNDEGLRKQGEEGKHFPSSLWMVTA